MPPRRVQLTFLGGDNSPKKTTKSSDGKHKCPPGHIHVNPKPHCRRGKGVEKVKTMPKFKGAEHHAKNIDRLAGAIAHAYAKEKKRAKKHGKSFTDFSEKFVRRKDPGVHKKKRATTKKKKKPKSVWSKPASASFWS
jgi:hypothetical protein